MTDATLVFEKYMDAVRRGFERSRVLVERAVAQLSDEELQHVPGVDSNSVNVTMKHMAGNLLSRWTDFLTSDGEKEWRHRDTEFVEAARTREEILAHWESGWAALDVALDSLAPADLVKDITIRSEPWNVMAAIERQMQHYGYHSGQIVYIARLIKGDAWETLSVPRGGSDAFNQGMGHLTGE